jgi:hemerythrin-like metal-binding protein
MTILSWHDQYIIGDWTIDEQHKMLFKLVNDFHTHWVEARDPKEISVLLNKLISYCEHHFVTEESIMEKEEYPKLEHHRNDHEMLAKTIFALNEQFAARRELASNDVQRFCKHWLVDHIVHSDYEFRDFLALKKQQQAVD